MSNTMNRIASDLQKIMSESDKKKTSGFDTQATVTRLDGDIAWVQFPGGEDETPVRRTTNAVVGDNVQVRVNGGRAWLLGNTTNPPTDDTVANVAISDARDANQNATAAGMAAEQAIESANTANEKAYEASVAAAQAQTDAGIAHTAANEAKADAAAANTAATQAKADAAAASTAAGEAKTAANEAKEDAQAANTAATEAKNDAARANTAANDSLSQLGIVEDVVGTLNWITTHATYKASADTEVHAGKWYFTKSGDTYNVVTNPTGNPSAKGYYEVDTIDEAVSNYVASHLALTNEGLYLTKDGNGYKILLANDGLKVYDPEGHLVSTFGESIIFDSARPQTIGNNNVYIKYYDKNNDGTPDSLAIKADEFLLSSGKTIQEELEGVENWFYSVAPTISNEPAKNWTTDKLKEQHLRDIYFDTTSGKSYRWAKDGTIYKWVEIEDVELAALAKDLHDNYPPRSEFTVAPDKIQSTVSAAQTAATNAANTATDNKLKSYSTTTQMNSAIEQKAGEITASVSSTYETKSDATSKLNTAKGYTDSEITSAKAEIKVTTDGISTEVSKKTDKSTIISTIRQSAETVKIKASQVEIDGTATFNAVKDKVNETVKTATANIAQENLLKDAYAPSLTKIDAKYARYFSDAANTSTTCEFIQSTEVLPDPYATHFVRITSTEAGKVRGLCFYDSAQYENCIPMIVGETYKVGCWVRQLTGDSTFQIYVPGVHFSEKTMLQGFIPSTEWTWFEKTFTFSYAQHDSLAVYGRIYFTNEAGIQSTESSGKGQIDMCGFSLKRVTGFANSGRNLLPTTKDYSGWSTSNNTTLNTVGDQTNIITFPAVTANTWREAWPTKAIVKYSVVRNKYVTFSAKVKGEAGALCGLSVDVALCASETNTNRLKYRDLLLPFVGTGDWQDVCHTFLITDYCFYTGTGTVNYDTNYFTGHIQANNTYHNSFQVKDVMLSLGADPCVWSPAPEDVQDEIDAKKSVHTLDTNYSYSYANILTYSAEGYGGTAGASWAVSSTEGVKPGDTVRLKVTVSDTDMNNTPVYIIGTVVSITSATVLKAISHGLDTTVIDGGKILTGSITANQLAANSITIGDMNQDAKDKVLNSNIQIGGENLLQQFLILNKPTDYQPYRIPLTENFIVGETYTLQLWGVTFNNTPAGGTVAAYWGGSSIDLTGAMTPNSDGYVATTFTITQAMANKNVHDSKHWFISIYNSPPSNSKTSRNMTLTRWKLEKGNKATDWSLSSADTKGGVNLLRCTAEMNVGSGAWAAGHFRASGGTVSHVSATSPHPDGVSGATRVTNTGSSATSIGLAQSAVPNLITNKLYTLSGWVKASAANLNIGFQPIWQSGTQTTGRISVGETDTSWGYYSATLRLTGDQATTYSAGYIYVDNVPANGWFEVCGLKLEEGPIATGWSLGNEADASNYISANGSGIRIASANPATQNQRMELTNSKLSMYDSGNTERLSLNSSTGVVVGRSDKGHSVINDSGLHVYNNTQEVASFGSTATIGAKVASSSYLHLEPNKMSLVGTDASNTPSDIFTVGNLLNQTNVDTFTGDGSKKEFELTVNFSSDPPNLAVKVNNVTKTKGTDYTHTNKNSHSYIVFTTAPAADADIEVSYTMSASIPYATFVSRKEDSANKAGSFVFGKNCEASGNFSHAFGANSSATNHGASADGLQVTASGNYSHAEGRETTASGHYAHAEGYGTNASGKYSHAEGRDTTASGWYSHVEGYGTETTTTAEHSHAEGYQTTVSQSYAHAEGYKTTASGNYAHAEGCETTAKYCGHAEGYSTAANGFHSHAGGYMTIADGQNQTVIGSLNVAQGTTYDHVNGDYIFIIGNGDTRTLTRSNALTVTWDGTLNIAGRYQINAKEYISIQRKTFDNLTVNEGATTQFEYSIARDGYTPIGSVGFDLDNATSSGTNMQTVWFSACRLNGDKALFQLHNNGSANAKVKVIIDVLYRAD